jgi:hypothetical protein
LFFGIGGASHAIRDWPQGGVESELLDTDRAPDQNLHCDRERCREDDHREDQRPEESADKK